MPDANDPVGTIRCPSCDAARSVGASAGDDDEPITHCEWCGAEYPVPHHPSAPEAHPGAGPGAPDGDDT